MTYEVQQKYAGRPYAKWETCSEHRSEKAAIRECNKLKYKYCMSIAFRVVRIEVIWG